MYGYEGMCMSKGKFLKPWQVIDKIIEGMQPQNKGPGMLWGQSYIMPMTSCDIIGMIRGVGCVTEGGSVMESWPVWKFE